MNFSKFIRYDVGDGTRVKFWADVWCRDRPFKKVFPDLYNISRLRDASIFEVMFMQMREFLGTFSFIV